MHAGTSLIQDPRMSLLHERHLFAREIWRLHNRRNCVRSTLDRWRNISIRIEDMKNEKGKSEKDRLVKYTISARHWTSYRIG